MAQIDRTSGFVGELGMKAPCNCATTGPIVLSGLQTVDGYRCTPTDNNGLGTRVLVMNQPGGIGNGIYYCNTLAWTLAPDFDGVRDVAFGSMVFVTGGLVNSGIIFRVVATPPIWPGTTAIQFRRTLQTSDIIAPPFLPLTNTGNAYQGVLAGYALDSLGRPPEGFALVVGPSASNIAGAVTLSIDGGAHFYPVIAQTRILLNAATFVTNYDAIIVFSQILQAWIVGGPNTSNITNANIEFNIQGGSGAVITGGVKGYLDIPYDCTIVGWSLYATIGGSISIDLQTAPFATFPTIASITGGAPPTLVSAAKAQSNVLTGWTTAVKAGTVMGFVVLGTPVSVTNVTVSVQVVK